MNIIRRAALLMVSMLCATGIMAQESDKETTGILLVHYGTQNDNSRAATVDLLNRQVAETFSHCKVVEAYAAPTVIKALAKRGIRKLTIAQALDSIQTLGCKRLVVQSTMLLDGVMTDLLRKAVDKVSNRFSTVSVARPLLYSVDDCRQLTSMIAAHLSGMKHMNATKAQVVLVGHGSDSPANAMYSQIDYLLKDEGRRNWHVGTIEGYPTIGAVERQLAKSEQKNVVLVPLLYIAGNHQRDDIDGVWRKELTAKGYSVSVVSAGLGEMQEVRDLIKGNIAKLIAAQEK